MPEAGQQDQMDQGMNPKTQEQMDAETAVAAQAEQLRVEREKVKAVEAEKRRIPKEGERVFYRPPEGPYAEATITKVWSPAMVNLRMDGADHDATSVNKRAGATAEPGSWWFMS